MFGFTQDEMKVLGSKGRFIARIKKFRKRNEFKMKLYEDRNQLRCHIIDFKKRGLSSTSNIPGWDEKFLEDSKNNKKPFFWIHPVIEHHFWWLMHNWTAHFMIGLLPLKPFFDFHDWTSKKLNAE